MVMRKIFIPTLYLDREEMPGKEYKNIDKNIFNALTFPFRRLE